MNKIVDFFLLSNLERNIAQISRKARGVSPPFLGAFSALIASSTSLDWDSFVYCKVQHMFSVLSEALCKRFILDGQINTCQHQRSSKLEQALRECLCLVDWRPFQQLRLLSQTNSSLMPFENYIKRLLRLSGLHVCRRYFFLILKCLSFN